MPTTTTTVDNGVNVEALLGAREALTAAPAAAQFQFRTSTRWVDGVHSTTTVHGFFGLGEEPSHRQPYTVDADHPEIFAATDNGPTPLELTMSALAACLTGGVASTATRRGVQMRSVVATIEGDVDLQGVLGIDSDVRNGFGELRVTFDIDADATREEIEGIVAMSQKRSAVFDALTNPTNVRVDVA